MAPPSRFKPEFSEQAEKLCLLGATDVDIADFFGVKVWTINQWKHKHPEFGAKLKSGKEVADERVERSLYHKAIGYTFDSEKVFQFQGQVIRAPFKEHIPPSDTACIFWLKNRRPQEWRDVWKHEHTGKDGEPIKTEEVSARDEISRRVAGIVARSGASPDTSKLN